MILVAQLTAGTIIDQSATGSATVYCFFVFFPGGLLPISNFVMKIRTIINACFLSIYAIQQNGIKLLGAVAQTQALTPTVVTNTWHSTTITYTLLTFH